MESVQKKYAPNSICFGCGPSNSKGLKINSVEIDNGLSCDWMPLPHHEAFPGVLNGGIIGSILDCHCNWTAAIYIMKSKGLDHPLCTVTANYKINLLRPTPSGEPVKMISEIVEIDGNKAKIKASLYCQEKECATCEGLFVAVKEGHPAYHRWN